jgi:primosomal protein N' (replication factor Y)
MATLFGNEASSEAAAYARVAVERGVDRYPDGLTYAVPAELASLTPGDRVVVPLGRGDTPTASYVIEVADTTPLDTQRLKFIARRDDAAARLPGQLIELARWISNYYCAPIGMTLASMLPAAVKRNVGSVQKTLIDLGDPLPLGEKLPPKQRQVLETLAALEPSQRPIEMRTHRARLA